MERANVPATPFPRKRLNSGPDAFPHKFARKNTDRILSALQSPTLVDQPPESVRGSVDSSKEISRAAASSHPPPLSSRSGRAKTTNGSRTAKSPFSSIPPHKSTHELRRLTRPLRSLADEIRKQPTGLASHQTVSPQELLNHTMAMSAPSSTAPLFPQDGSDMFVNTHASFASAGAASTNVSTSSPMIHQKSSTGRLRNGSLRLRSIGSNLSARLAGLSPRPRAPRDSVGPYKMPTPPPEDAKLGEKYRPWTRLTEWEMWKLRKKMKKNITWEPSDVMIQRELAARGRSWENYYRARGEAQANGTEFLDVDDLDHKVSIGDTVLLTYLNPNRPDIAQEAGQKVLNSASQSEVEDEEEESKSSIIYDKVDTKLQQQQFIRSARGPNRGNRASSVPSYNSDTSETLDSLLSIESSYSLRLYPSSSAQALITRPEPAKISYTISQDHTAGDTARRSNLLAAFGKKKAKKTRELQKEHVEKWKREEAEKKEKDLTPIAPSTEQSRPTTAKRYIMSILNDEPAEPPPLPKSEDIREELLQQDAQDRRRREREAARRRTAEAGGPAKAEDMDANSFIATLDPSLRRAILAEQTDEVLQHLDPQFANEARAIISRNLYYYERLSVDREARVIP